MAGPPRQPRFWLPDLAEAHERFHTGDGAWRAAAAAASLGDQLRAAWEPPPPPPFPPSLLLRAKYAVVPFHGRVDELGDLERWCEDESAPRAHLVVGAGGAGKTRLAIELCRRMRARGWLAGFLAEDTLAEIIDRVRELGEPAL